MDQRTLIRALRTARYDAERAPDRGCLAARDVAALAESRLQPERRDAALDHLADCSRCRRDVAFLKRGAGPRLVGSSSARTVRRVEPVRGPARWRWAAVAAGVLLAVTLGQLGRVGQAPATDLSGGDAGPSRVRATAPEPVLSLESPSEGAVVARDGLAFSWTELPGVSDYEIRVVSAEGGLVWEARTEASRLRVPDEVELEPGRRYYVRVSAQLSNGRSVRAPHVAFSLRDE